MTAGEGRHDGTRSEVKHLIVSVLVASHAPRRTVDLAEQLALNDRYVSHMLGELEAEGLVKRAPGRCWEAA